MERNPEYKMISFKKFLAGMVILAMLFQFSIKKIAHAAINRELNYQGKLTDSSGVAVPTDGYNIEFKLYTASSSGTAIWTETRTGGDQVTITDGLFSVLLGDVSTLDSVDFNQELWLGVNIGGTSTPAWDGEMTPRKKLASAPSAFEADKLDGVDSTQFLRSDQADAMSVSSTTSALTITQSGTGNVLDLYASSTNVLSVSDNGNVGIGTAPTTDRLIIRNDDTLTAFRVIGDNADKIVSFSIDNDGTAGTDQYTAFSFRANTSSQARTIGQFQASFSNITDATRTGLLELKNTNSGSFITAMAINGDKVGIATTTPGYELTVDGDTNITGALRFNGSAGTNGQILQTTGSTAQWIDSSSILNFTDIDTDYGDETVSSSWAFTSTTTLATTTISQWLSDAGNLGLDLDDDGSDLTMHANVGGSNSFNIQTDGAFFNLVANPGPSNGYLLASIAETQGATTELNFYEGGTGHNRFWNSGSMRIGGSAGYLCSTLTSEVDCDTAGTGADLVVQDDAWFGGNLISTGASSTYATTTSLSIAGDIITDFTGTGLSVSSGALTVATSTLASDLYVEDLQTTFTAGSIPFSNGSNLVQDNSNLFWNDSTNRLGIATTTPGYELTVDGDTNITGALRFNGSAGTNGYVLQTTGSTAEWVATSTLGIGGSTDVNALDPIEVGNNNTASGSYSSAIGYKNTAAALNSSVFGRSNFTSATASTSVALGVLNNASGYTYNYSTGEITGTPVATSTIGFNSITVGFKNYAEGTAASAVGYQNAAIGNYSSAFGLGSIASGTNSSVFGSNSSALGDYSSAFGESSSAKGANSLAIGYAVTASGNNSISIGYSNTESDSSSADFNNNTLVGYNNDLTILGSADINDSVFVGNSNSHGGSFLISGTYNYMTAVGVGNEVEGNYVSALGYTNTVSGNYSSASGYRNTAASLNSSVFGRSNFTTSSSYASVSIGLLNNASGATLSTATGAITGTPVATSTIGRLSTAVGIENLTEGNFSTAVGYNNSVLGEQSSAVGLSNDVSGTYGVAFGRNNSVQTNNSAAVGIANTVTQINSSAFGFFNTTNGYASTASGYNNTASGLYSIAHGINNTASANYSSAFGMGITNNIANSTQIGPSDAAKLTILSSGNVGIGTSTPTARLTIEGIGTSTDYSIFVTDSNGNETFSVRDDGLTTIDSGSGSGDASFQFGADSNAWSMGYYSSDDTFRIASSTDLSTDVALTLTRGSSLKLGIGTTTPASELTIEGDISVVNSTNSISVGYDNTSTGNYSMAYGFNNVATATRAIASGFQNTASGNRSSALGYENTASGSYTSAIGYSNEASGSGGSTASGYQNNATGSRAQAFGWNNTASGDRTSSLGYFNTASGNYSTVSGYKSVAAALNSSVFGRSNFTGSTSYASVSLGLLNNAVATLNESTGVITGTPVATSTIGRLTTAVGIENMTEATKATAIGFQNTVSGSYGVALGFINKVGSSNAASAVGLQNTASGYSSMAFGRGNDTTATGAGAFGRNNTASAGNAYAFGYNLTNAVATTVEIGTSDSSSVQIGGSAGSSVKFIGYGAGTLTTNSSGVITASSDERLKDISGLSTYGLEDLMNINPIEYKWNENSGFADDADYVGFSAQNIQSVIPEAVGIDGSGYLSLQDRPIMAVAVNSIKELNEKIATSTATNRAFIDQINLDIESLMTIAEENGTLIVGLQNTTQDLIDRIESFGITVIDGIANFAEASFGKLVASSISIYNQEAPEETGVVIYDRATGEPICVYFENGEMKYGEGTCDIVGLDSETATSTQIINTIITDNSTTTATSTDPVEDEEESINNNETDNVAENTQDTITEQTVGNSTEESIATTTTPINDATATSTDPVENEEESINDNNNNETENTTDTTAEQTEEDSITESNSTEEEVTGSDEEPNHEESVEETTPVEEESEPEPEPTEESDSTDN